MLYGHATELAVRATLYLALQPPGKLSPVREIAKQTGLPEHYLAKIIRQLASAGLVRAFRGPGGGIELGRAPDAISLWAIARAVDGPVHGEWCVLGLRGCSEEKPCPLHAQWAPLRAEMQRLLEETTLASLLPKLRGEIERGEKSWLRIREEFLDGPGEELQEQER